jgi:hypothetical protein
MDNDAGAEPFELTKRFIDSSPGAFPGFSLLTAFGEAALWTSTTKESNYCCPSLFTF